MLSNFKYDSNDYGVMVDRYVKILSTKAVSICVEYKGEHIELMPDISIWVDDKTLNGKYSYNLGLIKVSNDMSEKMRLISVDIKKSGDSINVWSDSSIIVSVVEINKILRMIGDASDYIGGVSMDEVEKSLKSELIKNTINI